MIKEDEVYQIGMLTRTHGVRGELTFQFTDDVWDRVEADYLFLRLDGLLVPFFLEEWRFRSDRVALLKFEDVDSAEAASALVGAEVYFPKALTPADVDEEELTWQHFVGFEVIRPTPSPIPEQSSPARPRSLDTSRTRSLSRQGGETSRESLLGTVENVYDQTANILLEITTPDGRDILIPAHEDFILRADHRERRLYVSVPDELLNLNA